MRISEPHGGLWEIHDTIFGRPVTRNNVTGPNFFNMDAAISKSFRVTEGMSGLIRAEAFNVLNHPTFSLPSTVNIDSTSGTLSQITATRNDNRIMQLTVRLQF